jgi:hypothetical protein
LHLQIGADYSEGAVKILPKFAQSNGRFGEIRCIADNSPLRVRVNAASVIAAPAQVGFARVTDLGTNCGEWPVTSKVDGKMANHHSQSAKGAQLCPFRIATDGAVACHHLRAAHPCRSLKS